MGGKKRCTNLLRQTSPSPPFPLPYQTFLLPCGKSGDLSLHRPTEPPTQPTSAGDEATQPTFFLPSHAIVGFVILPRRRLWRLGWRRRRRRSWLAAETSASALYSAAGREVGSSPTPMSKRRDSPKKPKDFLHICLSGSFDEGIFEFTVQKTKRLSNLVLTLALPAKEQTFFSFLSPPQTALPWQHEALPPRWRRRLRLGGAAGAAAAAAAVAEAEGLSLVWPSHAINPPTFMVFPSAATTKERCFFCCFRRRLMPLRYSICGESIVVLQFNAAIW